MKLFSIQIYRVQSTKTVYESFTDKMFVNASASKAKGLSVYVNLVEEFTELFTDVSLVVDLNDNNEYDFDLVRRTIDTCRLFKEPTYEPVIQFLYKLFVDGGNFPTDCPIKKVATFSLEGFCKKYFAKFFCFRVSTISKTCMSIRKIYRKWCPKKKQFWRSNICQRKIKKWSFWPITKYILRC